MIGVEDLPVFEELDDPAWAMDFHATYDDVFARPYRGLARLRSGEVIVYTNADAGVLRANPAVSHQGLEHVVSVSPTSGQSYPCDMRGMRALFEQSPFVKSGAEHRPGKQLISHVMSPRAVSSLRDELSGTIRSVLSSAADQGVVEFRDDVVEPVIAAFWRAAMGLEHEHTSRLLELTSEIMVCFRSEVAQDQLIVGDRAAAEFVELLTRLLRSNANNGSHPFLTDLVARSAAMGPEGRPEDPFLFLAVSLLDGFTTLAATQCLTAFTLLDAGVQPADHHTDPTFPGNAFMEAMRLNSPVATIERRAIKDIEHNGVLIPEGTGFLFLWSVSSRDPDVFADPNAFVLSRDNRTSQYSFGGGPYICGGRNVARIVAETLVAEMAAARISLELSDPPTLMHDRIMRDVESMPVSVSRT